MRSQPKPININTVDPVNIMDGEFLVMWQGAVLNYLKLVLTTLSSRSSLWLLLRYVLLFLTLSPFLYQYGAQIFYYANISLILAIYFLN
jgi:hypothetical protein